MTVVAVGHSSFLARAVREKNPKDWVFLSHAEALADTGWRGKADCVVNFAFSPSLRTQAYASAEDIDNRLAALIADRPVRYIMLSSRAAYGPAPADNPRLREGQTEHPSSFYGRNKLMIESALRAALGKERLTILRIANIFGFEKGRKSFFGAALGGLAEKGVITYNMNPAAARDFLAVWRFADALVKIAAAPQPGLFNLGSGFGTPCGKIAEWLIEGCGRGRLTVEQTAPDDSFWLDMTKTRRAYGLPAVDEEMLRADCIDCGRHLKDQ